MKKIGDPIFEDHPAEDQESIQRNLQEAEILKNISHPFIIKYIDHYNEEQIGGFSLLCIIMEYANGKILNNSITLQEEISERSLMELK